MSSLDLASIREDTLDRTTESPDIMETQTDSSISVEVSRREQSPTNTISRLSKCWKVMKHNGIFWVLITHYKLSSLIIFLQFLLNVQFLVLAITGGLKFWIFFIVSSILLGFSVSILALRLALFYRDSIRNLEEDDNPILNQEIELMVENTIINQNQSSTEERGNSTSSPSIFQRLWRSLRNQSQIYEIDNDESNDEVQIPSFRLIGMRIRPNDDDETRELIRNYLVRHFRLSLNDRDFTAEDYEMLLRLDEGIQNAQRRGMTKAQIERFPTYQLTNSSSQYGERCSICMEDFVVGEKLIILGCFHSFHYDCGCKWLETSKKCPICMLRADGSELENLIPIEGNSSSQSRR